MDNVIHDDRFVIFLGVDGLNQSSMYGIKNVTPPLCNTNKRLYGRINESLGHYVSHPNVELKVVAASTSCEFCPETDLIRDVSDIIG